MSNSAVVDNAPANVTKTKSAIERFASLLKNLHANILELCKVYAADVKANPQKVANRAQD